MTERFSSAPRAQAADGLPGGPPAGAGSPYGEEYFESHLGEHPYRPGVPFWHEFFAAIADRIVADLAPATVLDVGCAVGFLVQALRERGVEAWGVDVSEYALSLAPEETRPYLSLASATEPLERDYDLICCIEVLEHLEPGEADLALANITAHAETIFFSSTPSDFDEETHVGVRPMHEWARRFAEHGFFREVDFDAGFVAPHAILFRRREAAPPDVAEAYERAYWELLERRQREVAQLRARLAEKRAQSAELAADKATLAAEVDALDLELREWRLWAQRPGLRLFTAAAAARSRLAPPETRRDRLLRGVMRRLVGDAGEPGSHEEATQAGAVAFVSGCPGDAMRYRCEHHVEALGFGGATAEAALHGSVDLMELVERYRVVVLHRVAWDADVSRFLDKARRWGRTVLFDTDDLVFDPSVVAHVDAVLRELDDEERSLYVEGLGRYRQTLTAVDGVVVSTDSLAERARRVHDSVEIVPNAASSEMVELADRSGPASSDGRPEDGLVIGYFSGTMTHNRDFLEAADAVLWALATYPHVRLRVVGHLRLDGRFERFADRVERLPLQPWRRLPALYAGTDINLAPLERDNPFTEAKSCLKYIEAGLVGVPTVASARTDYRRAIRNGENGMLADTPEEWRDALRHLIEDPQARAEVGRRASEDARVRHVTKPRSAELRDVLSRLVPAGDGPLRVNWILRAPIARTGGGYRNIFRLAEQLAERGHEVRLYVEPIAHLEGVGEEGIRRFVEENFGPLRSEVVVGHDDIAAADVTIATNWPTAPTVARHRNSPFKAYFIQDFEPEFYEPGDDDYRQALATYDLPLRHICLGADLARRLGGLTALPADTVDFALDDEFRLLREPGARGSPVRVLFFARPAMKRRGYEIGVEALRLLAERRPDVEITFFGAADEELGSIPFPFRNHGVLGPAGLAAAMNESHVLLSFSLTNISNVPFEGMACGCAVVEANVPTVVEMVDPELCVLADADAESVARALERLVDDEALREELGARGAQAMRDRRWRRSGDQLEHALRSLCFARLGRGSAAPGAPTRAY